MKEHSWLSTKEAALLLGVSQRTVQNWVDSGKIKSNKTIGGHRRLTRNDLLPMLTKSLSVSSDIGEETTFSAQRAETGLRVLIVEDDLTILRLCELQFSLFTVPHQLFLATNACQGLFMAGKHLPHLIFTDLKMPHIDGIFMINEIMKIPDMKNTKIIAVTGLETREIMKMGKLPEGLIVLPKPIPFNTVETILYQQANTISAFNDSLPTLNLVES